MIQKMSGLKFHLHWSSITEGISYLVLLLIAMPLKYMAGLPAATQYVGMLHGILFVWYVGSVFMAKGADKLSFKEMAVALIASVIPFGTFYADQRIFRKIR